ncbi:MAG: cadherin-like beta sandwich domain-containing protein, partial [Desulfobacterales bacterium]
RIGTQGDWFFVGTGFNEEITEEGSLYLACWDYPGMYEDNDDAIHVTISHEVFNPADMDQDNDVDGYDLCLYLADMSVLSISDFAEAFGFLKITNNADLSDLSVSSGSLAPLFSSDHTDYLVTVENSVEDFFVTPVLSDSLASLRINDTDADSEVPFFVSLDTGSNYISIAVTSQDGSVVKTYSLLVVRQGRAALSSLLVTAYSLNPGFSPGTDVYTINVDPSADTIELTPESIEPGSLIRVNDIEVTSGSPVLLLLDEGINEAEISVTAADGSVKSYFVYVRKTTAATQTVYIVDHADASDEFETLNGAVQYLNTHILSDQTGEIRTQTTSPMAVDVLTITCNMFITVDHGASNVIAGPPGAPLVINAWGGFDISGLNFTNSPGYIINSDSGLSIFGCSFSSDATINISGASAALYTKLDIKGSGEISKDFNFIGGGLAGYLNVNLSGDTDADYTTVGTNAAGIIFDASGTFVGDAALIFKVNPVSYLNITAALKGNTRAQFIGHGSVSVSKLGLKLEENASVYVKQHTTTTWKANFYGVNGTIEFENVTTANADIKIDMTESQYSGTNNSITNFNLDLSYTYNFDRIGFTEKGGHFFKTFQINGEDAPTNAELIFGFDDLDINGNFNLFAGGKVTATFNNGTTCEANAFLKFPGNFADLTFNDIHFKASLMLTFPESGTQIYLKALHADVDKGMIIDFIDSANLSGTIDHITTITGGIMIGHDLLSIPGSGLDKIPPSLPKESPLADNQLIFKNLAIKDSNGRPGLYIDGVTVPVIIQDSTIDASLWSIVCSDIDADVTIQDNSDLKGGIFLNGDPGETGAMISRQYTVSNNTITQNMAGGSCLSSHAIHDISVNNNTMTAAAGAHGILLSGGKMIVNAGSINTMGPYISSAIGIGPSHGGANGILYAENVSPISGGVIPSEQGYVKLTGNSFSNAIVFDIEAGRLLNDPVADNSGLDPDEHIKGSLIDWNDDDHHCPDYPTKCDEWDEECGCEQDGIDPPTEPGI